MVREGRVLVSTNTDPDFGANYTVTAYEVGAQVASGSSGTTITVRAGHGFAANDKLIVNTDTTKYRTVSAVTSTTLTVAAVSVSAGDLLVNLGPDTGVTSPAYDGSGATTYADMDYTTANTNNAVTADSTGRYRYYHKGIPIWELVRDTNGAPFAVYTDASVTADEDRVAYTVRYVHLFATSGTGTAADPWVTAGSNPLQAAFADLPSSGVGGRGVLRMIPGCYSLGSGTTGFTADGANTNFLVGLTIEGLSKGNRASQDAGANVGIVNDDGAILMYSGTGAAMKIGDFTSTGSKTAEGLTLRNFKLRQTGTKGNGIGMLLRLFRSSNVEDVTITDFSTGVALASVSDFNTFNRLTCNDCHAYGVDFARTTDESGNALPASNGQCNGNTFNDCYVCLTSRDTTYTAYGFRVDGNAVKTVIRNCKIQNFDTANYAGILVNSAVSSTPSDTTTIDGCYFEGNYTACLFNNPNSTGTHTFGLSFTDNYVTQIEGYGIFVQSGSTGETDGVLIQGNVFTTPSSASPYNAAVGVQLGTYTQNCVVMGNHFNVGNVTGTLAGGNIVHGALGTITQNNFVLGSLRVRGAVTLDTAAVLTGGVSGGTPYNAGTWTVNAVTDGTDTACTNGTAYVGTVRLNQNATITGIQYLVGSVGGTNSVVVSLHSSTGALLANSTAAGTTVGTAAQIQQVPFTATYAAVGPATYFVALTFNGTTAKFRSVPAYCNAGTGVIGNGVTQTFGSPANFTAPTTFTADKVPVASLY